MILLARELINRYVHTDHQEQGNPDLMDRASALISAAATIEPNTEHVVFAQGFLLRAQARFGEAIALLEQLVKRAPNNCNAFRQLGISKLARGLPAEALPFLYRSIRLDPLSLLARPWHCSGTIQSPLNGSSGHWQRRWKSAQRGVRDATCSWPVPIGPLA